MVGSLPSSEEATHLGDFLPAKRIEEYDNVIDAMLDELKMNNYNAVRGGIRIMDDPILREIGRRISERLIERIIPDLNLSIRMLYGAALGYGKETQAIQYAYDNEELLLKTLEGMFLKDYDRRMRAQFR